MYLLPTSICLGLCLGLCPGVQTQTHNHRHAGDLLPSSPTVFIKDVDLLRLKDQLGLNPHHTTRPGRRRYQGIIFVCICEVSYNLWPKDLR